eukprot:scaffold287_cov337-Pavlova_lutheri.AAC.252
MPRTPCSCAVQMKPKQWMGIERSPCIEHAHESLRQAMLRGGFRHTGLVLQGCGAQRSGSSLRVLQEGCASVAPGTPSGGAPPLRDGFTRAVRLSPSSFGPFPPFLLAQSCFCATLTYRLCKMFEASLGVRIPAPPCLEGYPQGWRTPIPPHQTDSIDISARDRDWIRIPWISLSKISNPRARVGIEKDKGGDEAPSENT